MEDQYEIDQEDAAFDAGFADDDQGPVQEPEAAPKVVDEQPQIEEVAEAPLTRAEFQAMADRAAALEQQLIRNHDKAFGKMGELQQRIETLKGATYGLSPKARERLQDEFPELAEMLFDGEPGEVPPSINVDEIVEQKVQAKEEAIKQTLERRLLTRDHRDWEQVVQSDNFRQWVTTLPGEEQQQLTSTWDADFISEKLTAFKVSQKPVGEPVDDKKNETEKRNKRLEAALQPRGVSGPSSYTDDDEEAAMQRAFDG